MGFKGTSPWKQTGTIVIGKGGNVHLQVDGEDPQMQGQRSQITIHSSEQTLKSPRGVFSLAVQSRRFKVKV